mmetsp:Transcript_146635/g.470506  ORF Transcript_146635/g.470506 Transcript_146635/m.470506 type:complete len:105 (+) Transcript_146635:199-513(+)
MARAVDATPPPCNTADANETSFFSLHNSRAHSSKLRRLPPCSLPTIWADAVLAACRFHRPGNESESHIIAGLGDIELLHDAAGLCTRGTSDYKGGPTISTTGGR